MYKKQTTRNIPTFAGPSCEGSGKLAGARPQNDSSVNHHVARAGNYLLVLLSLLTKAVVKKYGRPSLLSFNICYCHPAIALSSPVYSKRLGQQEQHLLYNVDPHVGAR